MAELRQSNERLALGLVDVDFFKKFNDHYGHQAGDECLRQVAQTRKAAMAHARRFCEALERLALPHALSSFGVVTASVGVAAMVPQPGRTPELLVQQADQALYLAKQQGSNRVVVAAPAD